MSKFFLSRRRVVAAGIAIATVLGVGAVSTVAAGSAANADTPGDSGAPVQLSCSSASVHLTGYEAVEPGLRDVIGVVYTIVFAGPSHPGNPDGLNGTWSGAPGVWTFTTMGTVTSVPDVPADPPGLHGGGRWLGPWLAGYGVIYRGTPDVPNPNTVQITLNGVQQANDSFGGTYDWSTPLDGANGNHLQVTVVSPNDVIYHNNINFDETTKDCAPVATTVSWADPSPVTEGTSLAGVLNATVAGNGTALTLPADGTIAYSENGAAVSAADTLPVGAHTLNATFIPADATKYLSSSTTVILVVNAAQIAPAITSNPVDESVTKGQNASFSAAASGKPTSTVQWEVSKDHGSTWVRLPNQTDATLTFTAKKADDGNQYRAVFTNSVDSATSNAATLTVATAPVVTNQPDDETVSAGDNAKFYANASGTPTPGVQWQVTSDGTTWTDIVGATHKTLHVRNVPTSADGNQYRAVFTNSVGSATSDAATLTVSYAPAVTTDPTDQTALEGGTATFTAAASGNPTPSVQWQQYVQGLCFFNLCLPIPGFWTWQDIPGATSTSLSVPGVTPSMDGNRYRAVFNNSAGSATTQSATLHVTAPIGMPAVSFTPITACGTHGSITEPTADHVTFTIEGGDWTVTQGSYTITATPDNGYALLQSNGWNVQEDGTATFQVNLGDATVCTAPVAPTVTQAVCNGPGTSSPATVVDADGNGVAYAVAGDLSTVTATLQSGYQWQKDLPTGWTSGPGDTLVYTVPLTSPGACLITAAPRPVTAVAGTCNASTGFDSPATITSPTDGLDEGGITYRVAGLTVTATADAGYEIPPTQGWVDAAGLWTYTASVTQPFCPSVIALPGSAPTSPDGAVQGVPGTTNPGQQLDVTGAGFAPGATVNFGIYSTPMLLATVSADASGTARASIVIPAGFTGSHTVVAAGTGASGSPVFLASGTIVVAKGAPAPAGSSSHGVGGVSASRTPPAIDGTGTGVAPNGGSSSGLASTGTRENPIALTQIALLALLAGAGLLAIGRRRARKH